VHRPRREPVECCQARVRRVGSVHDSNSIGNRSERRDRTRVTLVARNEAKLQAHVARLGSGHRYLALDLSISTDVQRLAEDVRVSHYDVLINNAGVGVYGAFSNTPLAPTQAMLRLNIDCLVELSHAYLVGAKRGDALINVSSTLSLLSFPGATAYCATKAFVSAFSEGLWFENQPRGIYVACLLPGVTATDFHAASGGLPENKPPEGITQTSAQVVDEAMRALASRTQPTVLTSFMNKVMVFVCTRLLPRSAMIKIMGGQSPVLKAPPPQIRS
jgi:uncharacterized protein